MPYNTKEKKHKYYLSTKTVSKICLNCNKIYFASFYKPKSKYCSEKCRNIHSARTSAKLRGNIQRGRGNKWYVKYNGKHLHRLIMEKKLGRKLTSKEVVHHKDENKKNNKRNNLFLCKDQKEHAQLHSFAYRYLIKLGLINDYFNWFKRNRKCKK